jgi:predicted nucleotidyltransferase
MASLVERLTKKELIRPPSFVQSNTMYEVMMGSIAYGVSDDSSDVDLYGFCIPSKEMIFPHLAGHIAGFGNQIQRFEQFQQHHVEDKSSGKQYDITIYSIVRYFQLCMENNPNMVDSLFVPQRCVLHSSTVGNMVRENRRLFLHKGCFHKLKGYAYSQLHKMRSKNPEGKRLDLVEQFGYDTKYAYHLVRLLLECEQILTEHDLDLTRHREQLKAIRRGEVKEQDIYDFFTLKEKELEKLYNSSVLQYGPDEPKIKKLLLDCLEQHYGSLADCVIMPDKAEQAIKSVIDALRKYGYE